MRCERLAVGNDAERLQRIVDGAHQRTDCAHHTALRHALAAGRRLGGGPVQTDHLDRRNFGGGGEQIVREASRPDLPILVVDDLFEQRAAQTHGDGAVLLTLHDHRIEQGPAILDHEISLECNAAGAWIDQGFTQVCRVRVGHGRWVVGVVHLEPRLHALRQPQRIQVGGVSDLGQGDPCIGPLARQTPFDAAVPQAKLAERVETEHSCGDRQHFVAQRSCGDEQCAAAGSATTRAARAHSIRRNVGIAELDAHLVGIDAKRVGYDLREDGLIAVARSHQPDRRTDRARRLDLHPAGFVARAGDAGRLVESRAIGRSTTYGSAFYKAAGIPGSGHEAGWVKIEPSGAVSASVGLMGSGHGYETVFAQVVADALGIDPDQVRIQLGNTDIAPYGMGTRGARGGTAGGSALLIAARALREKVLAVAAAMLGLNTFGELRLRNGRIERRLAGEWTDAGIALAEVAHTAYLDPLRLPQRMEPGLEAHHAYDPPPMTYSNATHLCEALVDPHTGRVTLERYLVVEDCGTLLNPMIVKGQQHGAVAMGLSGALLEEIVYDENGQIRSGSFADYLLATAAEIPPIEVIGLDRPTPKTPTGSKGMAEGGVMGAIGALMSAVNDALQPFGVVADRQPLTPHYIRALLRSKTEASRPLAGNVEIE